jgi:hypothetical protein
MCADGGKEQGSAFVILGIKKVNHDFLVQDRGSYVMEDGADGVVSDQRALNVMSYCMPTNS